jgi:hypothetical protein
VRAEGLRYSQFAAIVRADTVRYAKIVKRAGVRMD